MKKAYLYILALVVWIIFLKTVCDLKEEDLHRAGVAWILVGIFYELCHINNKLK